MKFSENLLVQLINGPRIPEHLNLENLGIYSHHAEIIAAVLKTHPKITSINLSHNPITSRGIKVLIGNCPWVKRWDLSNTNINDEAVLAILALPELSYLNLRTNSVLTDISGKALLAKKDSLEIQLDDASKISSEILAEFGIQESFIEELDLRAVF